MQEAYTGTFSDDRESLLLYGSARYTIQKHILDWPQRYSPFRVVSLDDLPLVERVLADFKVHENLRRAVELETTLVAVDRLRACKNLATALDELGFSCRLRNLSEEAEKHYRRGLSIYEPLPLSMGDDIRFLVGRLLHDLAEVRFFQGEVQEAINLLHRRLGLFVRVKRFGQLGWRQRLWCAIDPTAGAIRGETEDLVQMLERCKHCPCRRVSTTDGTGGQFLCTNGMTCRRVPQHDV